MIEMQQYLEYVYQQKCSDLHLKAGNCAYVRKNGILSPLGNYIFENEDILTFCEKYANENIDIKDYKKTIDFSFNYKNVRFRGNAYHDHNGFCVSLRRIELLSTDFSELGIPVILKNLVDKPSGLILVTGPTGSGKSTTLAALINYINETEKKHIITIEDPIEHVFKTKNSVITQKELTIDVDNFYDSIVSAVREDPDIIVIGEMRDKESIEAALTAAETGHLVLSTLHTRNAASTISRIIDTFPTDKQKQILGQLSLNLLAVLSQQLLPSIDGSRLHLATELMIVNSAVATNIKQNKCHLISDMIELGKKDGMHLMSNSIKDLLVKGCISKETADKYIN